MSTKSNIRKREHQRERFEQKKLEADHPPILAPRIGITSRILEDLERRKTANLIEESEREGN